VPLDAAVVLTWSKVSPSAHLMVDPRNGARAVIRNTGAHAGRYLWSALAAGEMDSMSEARTDDLARAQFLAEAKDTGRAISRARSLREKSRITPFWKISGSA
jgi:hypothetical protein